MVDAVEVDGRKVPGFVMHQGQRGGLHAEAFADDLRQGFVGERRFIRVPIRQRQVKLKIEIVPGKEFMIKEIVAC